MTELSPSKVSTISYQLANNYDELTKKLQKESTNLKSFETFFREHSKLNENYSKSLSSLLSYLRSQPNSNSSLQTAVNNLSKELEEFCDQTLEINTEIQRDIVKPLEMFRDHFEKQSSRFIKNGNNLLSEISESRKNVNTQRDLYTKNAIELEKLQQDLREFVNNVKESTGTYNAELEKKTTKALDLKLEVDANLTNYKKSVEKTNSLIQDKYDEYYTVLEAMLQLEESREEFVKNVLKKHLDYSEHISKIFLDKTNSIRSVVEYVNSTNDMHIFVSELKNTGLNPLFIPIETIIYQPLSPYLFDKDPAEKHLNIEPDYFGNAQGGESHDIRIILEQSIIDLTDGKVLSLEEKATAIEQLHKPSGKEVFAEVLSNITHPTTLPPESFKIFGELVNYLLTAYVLEKDSNEYILSIVLNASKNIQSSINGRNQYLFSELSKHGVWQEMERWRSLMRNAIEEKVQEAKHIVLQRRKDFQETPKGGNGLFGSLKGAISGLGKKMGLSKSGNEDENLAPDMRKAILSAVSQVLGQFVFYFSNLRVRFEKAQEILRYFGLYYGLDPMKIYEMELTLKANQPFNVNYKEEMNIGQQKDIIAQQKYNKKLKKFGENSYFFILSKFIPYISDLKSLQNILLLSKSANRYLKNYVFRHLLLEISPEISISIRLQIWFQIIDLSKFEYNYDLIKEKLQKEPNLLPKSIDDLIGMDVMRSMPDNKLVSHPALLNILKVYACYNKKVEYCQGMNFIVGFLYLLLQDESKVFKFFVCLIEKYKMKDLFTQDVPLLKRYFYQIDRLLFIHCPEINEYFRSESVNASFFTSAWFITLFTYTVQHTKGPAPPPMLLHIWDAFLLEGWKGLFKAGIFIVKELQKQMLEAKFDDLMMIFGGLPKSQLFINTDHIPKMLRFMKSIKISNSMLEQLDKEYNEELESIQTTLGLGRINKYQMTKI